MPVRKLLCLATFLILGSGTVKHFSSRVGHAAVLALAASSLAGCGANIGNMASSNDITGYEAANYFSPVGYSVAQTSDGHFRITTVATVATPKDRVEKIASARAAEYGAESQKKFFLATPARLSIRCGKTEKIEKGQKIAVTPHDYAVAEVDVVYADTAVDPSYLATKGSADALKAELQSQVVASDASSNFATEASAQCKR